MAARKVQFLNKRGAKDSQVSFLKEEISLGDVKLKSSWLDMTL